uniref:NADH-ubiquinone oxidoreductase chain 2 n=1 Tax=Metanephrops thomsoni TaxID=360519 RepID=A0A0K0PS73_9EUCA|nr:NADH dehydrogenase subunit 2 [Metanephrops thomsoni]AKQ49250.1 NADH dehydrogenase subunit 2 [Metanephrops thomsoni]
MLISPSQLMFFSSLSTGMILSISSPTWFGAWAGLELNLMSFIPLIITKNNQYSSEAALKYFLIQALGSALIVFAASTLLVSFNFSHLFLTIALLLKLGAAPFHFWFPQVMEGMNWIQAITLMTIQKIAPMLLISYLSYSFISSTIIFYSIILSAIVGAIGGINQMLLRKIMAFSSINHMAWMLSAISISESMWMMYFLFYAIMSSSIALIFHFQQIYQFSQITSNNASPLSNKILMFMSLLSLGGLPPFSGFIPKWMLIQEMTSTHYFPTLFILLSSTLISLYYYLRISISALVLYAPKMKWASSRRHANTLTPMMTFLNLAGLLVPSVFIMF